MQGCLRSNNLEDHKLGDARGLQKTTWVVTSAKERLGPGVFKTNDKNFRTEKEITVSSRSNLRTPLIAVENHVAQVLVTARRSGLI